MVEDRHGRRDRAHVPHDGLQVAGGHQVPGPRQAMGDGGGLESHHRPAGGERRGHLGKQLQVWREVRVACRHLPSRRESPKPAKVTDAGRNGEPGDSEI